MTLLALVLLASFFLEDNDLFSAAMADDGRWDSCISQFCILAGSDHERLNIYFSALFAFHCGDSKSLPFFNGELFSTRPDNCVTHIYFLPRPLLRIQLVAEKLKLYGKPRHGSNLKVGLLPNGPSYHRLSGQAW